MSEASAGGERGADEHVSRVRPRRERLDGFLLLVGLHLCFTALTLLVGRTIPMEADARATFLADWWRLFAVLQGIWVLPAVLTAALLSRRYAAEGIGLGAGATLLVWGLARWAIA